MTDFKYLAFKWAKGIGKTLPLNRCVPIGVNHQDLLTILMNTGIRGTQMWGKGLRAHLRKDLPIIDFHLGKTIILPYHAAIDDQGFVTLFEVYDNGESFKMLAESQWDIRQAPLKAAADIAVSVVATVETHFMFSKLVKDLYQTGGSLNANEETN